MEGVRSIEPLNASDFILVGFPDPQAIEKRRIQTSFIHADGGIGLGASTFPNAIFIPARYNAIVNGYPSDLRGGLLDTNGAPVGNSQLRRGGSVFISQPDLDCQISQIDYIDADVLWLGWLFEHFGHFLLESLGRAWFLPQVGSSIPVIFNKPDVNDISQPMSSILGALDVPPDRILPTDKPLRFRNVICPDPAFELQYLVHPCFVEPFRKITRRVVDDDVVASDQPLYLSRSALGNDKRRIDGETELEEWLVARGVAIYHPQEHDIEDQVRTLNKHRVVISSNGSAAHLILFARQKPHLYLLAGERLSQDFFLCSKLADSPTKMMYCLSPASGLTVTMDVERAKSALMGAGV